MTPTMYMWGRRLKAITNVIGAVINYFRPCQHRWEDVSRFNIYHPDMSDKYPYAVKQVQRCKHCDDYRSFHL